jgi:RimJ/RimL family protein N-acetyltransferase
MTLAPAIDTDRLTLRGHRAEDLHECAAMWGDPVVTRHVGGRPFSEEEVWSKLLRYVGHWSLLGFGYWVVRDRASGRFVGEVGFADFRRDITPSFDGAPEAGWVLLPWAHGRGLATEAVGAAIAWLETHGGRVRTVCMIDPGNAPSIRVALKCGFREWTRASYKGEPAILFERSPADGRVPR